MNRLEFIESESNDIKRKRVEGALFDEAVDNLTVTHITHDITCPNCNRTIKIACLPGGPFEESYHEARAKILEERIHHLASYDQYVMDIIYSLCIQGKWKQ